MTKSKRYVIFTILIIIGVIYSGCITERSSSNKSDSPAATNPDKTTTNIAQKTITNSIGMEFILIPAGEFDMGSPSNEESRFEDEGPVHHVKIGKAFYMGKYEVTQKQWRDVMGKKFDFSQFNGKGDNLPVETVFWSEAQDFVNKLNKNEGTDKYRLPSEAEWEYAARAGTTTRFSFGDDGSELGDYAWYEANSGKSIHDVGQKKPNPWGLYDMQGNVAEWVQDNWHNNYNASFDTAPPIDGSAWESEDGSGHVNRGCGWTSGGFLCRSATRGRVGGGSRYDDLGFRLVRDV